MTAATATPRRQATPPIRKRFGQHFLTDAAVIDRIFAALALAPADNVLEIGPGGGALTEGIARQAATLTAIEIDRDLAAALAARLPRAQVLRADVLKTDLASLLASRNINRVVGNLPYNIATTLLGRLFALAETITDMQFMVQAEVAARLTSAPGSKSYGRLSVLAQHFCRIEELFAVDAESFAPPPKVRSAFVRITAQRPEPCDLPTLRLVLRTAFGGRRKVLRNALESLQVNWSALGIDPQRRAEDLPVSAFVAIANHVQGDPLAASTVEVDHADQTMKVLDERI